VIEKSDDSDSMHARKLAFELRDVILAESGIICTLSAYFHLGPQRKTDIAVNQIRAGLNATFSFAAARKKCNPVIGVERTSFNTAGTYVKKDVRSGTFAFVSVAIITDDNGA